MHKTVAYKQLLKEPPMGRTHHEHLAQQVALRSTMPSTSNEVTWLRAQLALRDAQIEQVKAQRDSHFVQEEEVLAHMRLLSSEAKDWKSRVVTEAEEVLCRESAEMAQHATEAREAMDQQYKAKWQQAETDLKALCQSNSAQVQSFASKMHETNVEHQQLHEAQERRIQLEAQALREAHQLEQQAAHTAQEYLDMVQTLRQQADEQPDKEKLLWKRHLSQQADYRAEIHELHTELLNMRERSEMKSHLAANMCRVEQTVPSRTVEAEPDNTLNTLSPGRSSRWILPHELETPNPQAAVPGPDELHDIQSPVAPLHQAPLVAARCVNGTILRPSNVEHDQPSTACQQSEVCAPGGVPLGRGTPGQQQSPGGRRGRDIDPPPPPPPPPVPHASAASDAAIYPLQWTPLHAQSKAAGGGPPGGPTKSGEWQWKPMGSSRS